VEVVRWHPNCHYIATGSADRTVRLWDIRTGDCCRIFLGHRAAVS
jgi:transcription initiation factor TFIID subunit 5